MDINHLGRKQKWILGAVMAGAQIKHQTHAMHKGLKVLNLMGHSEVPNRLPGKILDQVQVPHVLLVAPVPGQVQGCRLCALNNGRGILPQPAVGMTLIVVVEHSINILVENLELQSIFKELHC